MLLEYLSTGDGLKKVLTSDKEHFAIILRVVDQCCDIITNRIITPHPHDKLSAACNSFIKGINEEALFQYSL